MLQLVLGIAGTGKSTVLMREMQNCVQQNKECIFLVPEQFSSSAEGLVYRALGDEMGSHVQVLSFRTLAARILRHSGGAQTPVVTEAGRVVFVRRALKAVEEKLKAFARQKRSVAFCQLCAQAIAELKTAGANPAQLSEIAFSADDDKLAELAMIFDAYEQMLAGVALDSEDCLVRAAEAAAASEYLNGKVCFVDGFDGFTPPEMQMLGQLLCLCSDVNASLCCDALSKTDGELDVFEPVRRAARGLKRLCESTNVAQRQDIILSEPKRAKTKGLMAVNLLYAGADDVYVTQCDDEFINSLAASPSPQARRSPKAMPDACDVYVTQCYDEWQEVSFAASEMYALALSGVPYSKMALVCRDTAKYEAIVRRQLALYNIPCFIDEVGNVEYTPATMFMRAALALLRSGLVSEHILALVKTGLCGFSDEDIAALENYVFTWQPKAADWRNVFDKNPEGLLQRMDDEAATQLQKAEKLRAQLVPILDEFMQKTRGCTAQKLCKQLYYLLSAFNAAENAQKQADELEGAGSPANPALVDALYGNTSLLAGAETMHRAWDLAMDILDDMALMLKDEKISADEFDELLVIMARCTDFGHAPQTLESAVFTSADRMRLADVDYCFVLGVCEGQFPMQVGYSGLLNHTDRDLLVKNGIQMPGSFENRTLLEDMFFYRALATAQKRLYISWPKRCAGEVKTRSLALNKLCGALNPPCLAPSIVQLAGTPAAAYDLLCQHYREDTPLAGTLYALLAAQGSEETQSALRLLKDVDNAGYFSVDDADSIKQLVGANMQISPTAAEKYYTCRFAYYIERVLKLKSRRKAELSHMESGTFVHYILEQVLCKVKDSLAETKDYELERLASEAAEKFMQENTIAQSRREAFSLQQVTRNSVKLLCFLRDMATQSSFSINALELGIGYTGAVPPLKLCAENGADVQIGGKVDRVDTFSEGQNTYLCIIDYKTGDKKLNLDEVYCGTNMQMMVYMDALKNAAHRYPNAVPAAALYLWSEPAPAAGNRHDGDAQQFRLMGILTDDIAVLNALDNGKNGQYIPVKYKKDGTVSKTSPVVSEAKFNSILQHVEGLLAQMAGGVYGGNFAAQPLVNGQTRPCRYCAYRAACRHEDGVNEKKLQAPPDAFETEVRP